MALRMSSLGRCLLGARRLSPLHLKVPKNQNSDTSVNYTCNTLSHCNSNASHPFPIFVHFQGCQYLSTSSATQHARSQLPVGVIKPDEEPKIFRWTAFIHFLISLHQLRGKMKLCLSLRSPWPNVTIPEANVADYVWENVAQYSDNTALVCGLSGRWG